MIHKTVEKFVEALHELEENEQIEKIAALFDDECEIGNVTLTETMHGKNGAADFWANYRKTFGKIKSSFRNKIISESTAALEWTSTGTSSEGGGIDYEGVSILEIENDKIVRFFAYFNPAKLGHQIAEEKS